MGLGLSNGATGGEYLPIVKWDARAGRMFRVDRTQGANGWESQTVDITNERPTFLIDFGAIEVGHMAFTATGPSFALAPLGQPMPARPSPEHKQGCRVRLYSPKFLGGLREFASSAKAVLGTIDALHTAFEAAPEAAAGKIPAVQLDGSTAITTKGPNGTVTSYAPVLKVVSWHDRPADLGERTVPAPAGQRHPQQHTDNGGVTQAAPSNHVPPPTPKAPETAGMPSDW